jgi:hypothetical protein
MAGELLQGLRALRALTGARPPLLQPMVRYKLLSTPGTNICADIPQPGELAPRAWPPPARCRHSSLPQADPACTRPRRRCSALGPHPAAAPARSSPPQTPSR